MAKITPQFISVFLVVLACFCSLNLAQTPPRVLTPKSKASPQTPVSPAQPKSARKNYLQPAKVSDHIQTSSFESTSFSALIGTPLIYESFYEKRFAALGNFFLFSIPLYTVSPNFFFHVETGPSFSFARLTFENPPLQYSHIYLLIPAHFRVIYSVSRNFHLEGFAGVMLRPIEYDSRTTSDGGTHRVKDSRFLSPDGGLGLDYNISQPIKIRFLVGYLFLSGGMELTW